MARTVSGLYECVVSVVALLCQGLPWFLVCTDDRDLDLPSRNSEASAVGVYDTCEGLEHFDCCPGLRVARQVGVVYQQNSQNKGMEGWKGCVAKSQKSV